MYIDSIELGNVRTFWQRPPLKQDSLPRRPKLDLVHPERDFRPKTEPPNENDERLPRPRLPNVTLILGDNGSGKSTALRAIAASAFGPAAKDLLRDGSIVRRGESTAVIEAQIRLHEQDGAAGEVITSILTLQRKGERLDVSIGTGERRGLWEPVYESKNDAFFIVGYGATRRVERLDTYDSAARAKSRATRDLRVQSLFEDSFSLIPLGSWLPREQVQNPGRFTQVVHLLNELLKPGEYTFSGKQDDRGDYLFDRGDLPVPFQSLSDGYRAFVGWVADLLHHLCYGCPSGKKLVENRGVVLVDEIDLHLHPKWQMQVIKAVAKALPEMQFVFTSHSPLVASSLEWMNINLLKVNANTNETVTRRLRESIHGLDADQVLISRFFGLSTTRAASKARRLDRLTLKARAGDEAAAKQIIAELAAGTEHTE